MKKAKLQDVFIEHLRKLPNVSSACEQLGISRQSVYRWRQEDQHFAETMELALSEGDAHIDDFVENKLLKKIREDDVRSITYYLDRRHPKYKRIQIDSELLKILEDEKRLKKKLIREQAERNVFVEKVVHPNFEKITNPEEVAARTLLREEWITEDVFLDIMRAIRKNPEITLEEALVPDIETTEITARDIAKEYIEIQSRIEE